VHGVNVDAASTGRTQGGREIVIFVIFDLGEEREGNNFGF